MTREKALTFVAIVQGIAIILIAIAVMNLGLDITAIKVCAADHDWKLVR